MASSKKSASGWALIQPKDWDALFAQLNDINHRLDVLTFRGEKNMATVTEGLNKILAEVTAESGKIDSLAAFVATLKQQLLDALAGTITPEQQAAVDAVFAAVQGNEAKVVAAMDATPPA